MNQENSTTLPRRKKVLFIITKSNFGGAQRYVYDLAMGLPRESLPAGRQGFGREEV